MPIQALRRRAISLDSAPHDVEPKAARGAGARRHSEVQADADKQPRKELTPPTRSRPAQTIRAFLRRLACLADPALGAPAPDAAAPADADEPPAMNGAAVAAPAPAPAPRAQKPPPAGPAPPVPAAAPPAPPTIAPHHGKSMPPAHGPGAANGAQGHAPPATSAAKGKKKGEPSPVDPAAMYESLKNRIAALEEEEVHEEEEEKQFAAQAQSTVKGMADSAVHAKYIELFAEFKRMERDHAKERQKLTKDKDSAKSQLTKANQAKTKMENLARELQKENKRLREDSKRLVQSVEDAQEEILQMKNDVAKRIEKAKARDSKYREMPDIVVKVVCRYRAELFFKISRKTKLSRLFNAWTDRMAGAAAFAAAGAGAGAGQKEGADGEPAAPPPPPPMQFMFTHSGRTMDAEQTPEEAGIDDGDEILAVEIMDLTEGPEVEEMDAGVKAQRQVLRKNWTADPDEAKRTIEEIFNGVVRERLKDILRQYELRERHFECVVRSKELEVLLSRARAAEQKQLCEQEKNRADKLEDENQQVRQELADSQNGQTMLIDKLIQCCKEPNAEKTQRLFASLREELEKRGISSSDGTATGAVGG